MAIWQCLNIIIASIYEISHSHTKAFYELCELVPVPLKQWKVSMHDSNQGLKRSQLYLRLTFWPHERNSKVTEQ